MSTQVQQLRSQADAEIAGALDVINQELEVIAELNAQIANNLTQNLPVGDLQDRRDVAVKTISGYMGLQEFTDATGQIRLFTQSGRSLVSGVQGQPHLFGTISQPPDTGAHDSSPPSPDPPPDPLTRSK